MIEVRLTTEKCEAILSGKISLKEKGLNDLIKNGLQSLQILIRYAKTSEKRLNMMSVYVEVLIKIMALPPTSNDNQESLLLSPDQKELLSLALDNIASTGKIYPQEFKRIINQGNGFRAILEGAIKRKQEADSQTKKTLQGKLESSKHTDGHRSKNDNSTEKKAKLPIGSIKLKTDFSNFYTTNSNKSNNNYDNK